MIYIADIIACGLVVLGELIAAIMGMVLIQLISYKFFKVNLYKKVTKALIKIERGIRDYV